MSEKFKQRIRTGAIILLIYVIFVLYLLLVSNRIENLENRSESEPIYYSLIIG